MNKVISDNYNQIYHKMLWDLNAKPDFQGLGEDKKYKERINVGFNLTDPSRFAVMSKSRSVDYKYAKDFWSFMRSGKEYLPEEFIEEYPHAKRFLESGELPETFSSAYGPKIKRQLPRIIKLLKSNPDTRWAVINILLEEDKKIWDHKTTMEYPCCNTIHFMIRNGELHMMVSMRSNNMVIVIAYDVYLNIQLMEKVAKELKIPLGTYNHNVNSAHFFGKQQLLVNKILEEYYG